MKRNEQLLMNLLIALLIVLCSFFIVRCMILKKRIRDLEIQLDVSALRERDYKMYLRAGRDHPNLIPAVRAEWAGDTQEVLPRSIPSGTFALVCPPAMKPEWFGENNDEAISRDTNTPFMNLCAAYDEAFPPEPSENAPISLGPFLTNFLPETGEPHGLPIASPALNSNFIKNKI